VRVAGALALLLAAILGRGDVKGVFVGHDHVNDYVGDYFGVRLGYSANTGFGTYGLDGEERDRMRGAPVFVIQEDRPEDFETFMVFAADYGIWTLPLRWVAGERVFLDAVQC
jgi:hypothetical protein